jgi:uncharacterized protein (TIGR02996 family)
VTDDQLALLRTIREYPDADLPRLVYADWLEERGDPDRAEFLRLQIERNARIPDDPDARGIGWREYQLLLAHELRWKAELPPGFRTGAAFRRGLIHRASCRARDLFAAADRELTAPIEVLSVEVDEANVEWLGAVPPAFGLPLRELSIRCAMPVGPYLAQALGRCGPFRFLRTLRISDPTFGDDGVAALPSRIDLPAVTHLDVRGCGLTDAVARVLIETGWIGRLDRLDLSENPLVRHTPALLRDRYPGVRVG